MSSALMHATIPTLFVMATGLFPRKQILLFLPFAFISDLDFLFNFLGYYVLDVDWLGHRSYLHNIFIGMPTAVLWVVLWRRMMQRDPELHWASFRDRWSAFGHVKWGYASVLMTVFLESHVFLDMMAGGVTLFWPLLDVYIYPEIILFMDTTTGELSVAADVQTGEGAPALTPLYQAVTPHELGILILALAAAIVGLYYEYRSDRLRRPLDARLTDDDAD